MTGPDAATVLDFWFGPLTDDGATREERGSLWFRKDEEQDAVIRARFGALVEEALAGRLEHWSGTATGRLALIIVLDQFTRNIGRDTPAAFAGDPHALRHALAALDAEEDRALAPIQRVFLYMPLEHAEDLALQERCVALFRALEEHAPAARAEEFRNYTWYAEQHRDVVRRFGRFPHRNAILGRTSTPDEEDYLRQPGAGF